ncbi:MAG: uroporphyrinogen decarboxylase [Neomegalonema sp.]|nr:uroporphyrinogen decarboxylase [Neomegalonema sp.]
MRALRGHAARPSPVWIMRQAGRYLPEYRELRAEAGDFLSLCFTPKFAVEATLQPIRRYQFDAAILFSDILVVNWALGQSLRFAQGEGPLLSPVSDAKSFETLNADALETKLEPVYEAVRSLKQELGAQTPLIGFAGAPWTLATYAIAGRGTPDQAPAKSLLKRDPDLFLALLDLLERSVARHLAAQIEAGVDAVKVFDSWASAAPSDAFERICLESFARIRAELAAKYPDTPVIAFPRGVGKDGYAAYDAHSGADCLALDQSVDLVWAAQNLTQTTALQGALDPALLLGDAASLERAMDATREAVGDRPHVLNLGHGVTPDVPPEMVAHLVNYWRGGEK